MTEKKFRFLEQLEDDLRDAAARERVASESKEPQHASRTSRSGDGRWTRWLAAAVVVLVVAGGIGGFVRYRDNRSGPTFAGSGSAGVWGASGTAAGHGISNLSQQSQDQAAARTILGPGFANQPAFIAYQGVSSAPAPKAAPATATNGAAYSLAGSAPVQQDISKIVRNGVITVELPAGGFAKAETRVDGLAKAAGGYVVSSSARGSGSGTFVLRIPAKNFDAVMGQLAPWPGGKVLWRNTTGQDVTAQYIDSSASLQILKAQKAATLRYLKNAGSLSQAIQFRNQAFQIQGEIDKLQGQLNYLKDQVALATITVNLRESGAPATHKPAPVTKPSLVRAWDRAVSGFLGVLSAVIVGLGFLVPIGILALLIGVPLMALTRKRRAASSAS